MASKFAWLVTRRKTVLAVASVLAAVLGAACGHSPHDHDQFGFWDW